MKKILFLLLATSLSGCTSLLSPRKPVIEDKVGLSGREIVGTLSTASDYRVVYVKLEEKAQLCAESSPDSAAQFASTLSAAINAPLADSSKPLSANAQIGLSVAMKQLFRRSQGVQLYRDGVFALCNLYLNGGIQDRDKYLIEMQALRKDAVRLVELEIPFLERVTIDPIQIPAVPVVPAVEDPSKNSPKK